MNDYLSIWLTVITSAIILRTAYVHWRLLRYIPWKVLRAVLPNELSPNWYAISYVGMFIILFLLIPLGSKAVNSYVADPFLRIQTVVAVSCLGGELIASLVRGIDNRVKENLRFHWLPAAYGLMLFLGLGAILYLVSCHLQWVDLWFLGC